MEKMKMEHEGSHDDASVTDASAEISYGEQKDSQKNYRDNSGKSNRKWRALLLVGIMALAVLAAIVTVGSSKGKKKQRQYIPNNPTFALHQAMTQVQPKSRSLVEITLTVAPGFWLPPPDDDPTLQDDDTDLVLDGISTDDIIFTGESFDDEDSFVAPDPDEVLDVLIIGAGWSGLGAGEALADEGVTFKILEAADYIGGRTKSDNTLIPGYPLELGSAWSYPGTDLHKIIEDLGLNSGVSHNVWESTALYEDFQLRAQSGVQDQPPLVPEQDKEDLVSGLFKDYSKSAEDADDGVGYLEAMENFLKEQTQFLFSPLQDRQFLNSFLTFEIESEFAAPYSDLSIADTSYELLSGSSDLRFMAIPGGGFQRAVREVAGPIRQNIQLNSRVSMIDYSDPDVATVTYERENVTYVQKARTVLVTVSVGVLQDPDLLSFNPPLPQEKLDAINDIGMGTLNRMILHWNDTEPFWPLDKEWLQLATANDNDSGLWTTFFNPISQGNGGEAVLEAWVGGDYAYQAEEMTDNENLSIVLNNLREMFGVEKVDPPTQYLMTRWGSNNNTKGSYSYPRMNGNTDEARKTLGKNVDNIFFAGEATSDFWGTATGAYSSGGGAIDDILKVL